MKTNNRNLIIGLGILVVGIFLGWAFFGGSAETESVHEHDDLAEDQIWTCSMHPQIRQQEPGQCPICGMDLIPLSEEQSGLSSDMFQMSEQAMKLANITTITVGTGEASKEIRLNGKVVVDERNSYTQATHIPGRIEQLRVNFTGEKVNKGQVLATVYSPEIVTAQEELLQAQEIKESQPELFQAAKQKLRNWKISESQIQNMLNRGEPIQRFPITADVSGVVTELMAEQGDYLERGMPVYQIANLNKVWILFDLYESDLSWVEEGSTVNYTVQSLPGQSFKGEITFIDPVLDSNTRVATARIEVANPNGKLKPGMFVSGVVENELKRSDSESIVIPKSAVLWTGERSVVYVKENLVNGAGFEMREVILGPALGDSYVIESGLTQGEEVVVNGTFTVDAAVQLAGKPSMMNPNIGESRIEPSPEEKGMINPLFVNYLKVKDALVNDSFSNAQTAISDLELIVSKIETQEFSKEVQNILNDELTRMKNLVQNMKEAGDISGIRDNFDELSNSMINLAKSLEVMEGLYVQHCPMANSNTGADWLSLSEEIKNPYYGASMLTCGEIKTSL